MLVLTLAILSTSTNAFVPGFGPRATGKPTGKQLYQVKRPDYTDSSNNQDEPDSGWVSWMKKGRKTSALIYREPEELGGIIRPDRYSSR
jgi:hypothetical protein